MSHPNNIFLNSIILLEMKLAHSESERGIEGAREGEREEKEWQSSQLVICVCVCVSCEKEKSQEISNQAICKRTI